MVLEEEIRLGSEDEAQACARLLKSLDISAHIRTRSELDTQVMYKGTYSSLTGMIQEMTARLQDSPEEDTEELVELFQIAINHLKEQHGMLEDLFREKKPGDRIGSTLLELITKNVTIPDTDETMNDLMKEATLTQLLYTNNLIEIDGDELILNSTIPPDDAEMTVFSDYMPPIEEDLLNKWNIFSSLEATDNITYIVTTGPDVVFLDDISPMEEFFREYDYDEDENPFFADLQIKQLIVAEILSLIQKEGKASLDELTGEFLHREIPLEEKKTGVRLHISPAYIEGVIFDMKKIGMLKGKDQRLKIGV